MKSLSKNNRVLYWAQIIVVGLVVGVGIQMVQAWSGPTQSAPNGNVAGPLTTSATQQSKTGNLILGNDLAVSRNAVLGTYVSTSNASGLCLSGICHTTWASVLAGVPGGGVTAVNGGNGLTVNQTTGNVTVSANTTVLQSRVNGTCPAGEAIRVIAADGSVTCEVDDTGAGGGVTSIAGGTAITVNNPTGNVTVGVDPSGLAAALFGGATLHTCNLYNSEGSSKICNIGTKNMCFLVNVFGRDGDDVDGFGCSAVGSPGNNWYIRNVGEDFAQVYCQAMCI